LKPDMEKIFNIQVMLSIYFLESWKWEYI
jgi:hypothetical protein